jgi:hypothetical protein
VTLQLSHSEHLQVQATKRSTDGVCHVGRRSILILCLWTLFILIIPDRVTHFLD